MIIISLCNKDTIQGENKCKEYKWPELYDLAEECIASNYRCDTVVNILIPKKKKKIQGHVFLSLLLLPLENRDVYVCKNFNLTGFWFHFFLCPTLIFLPGLVS